MATTSNSSFMPVERLSTIADIQRNFFFELHIPNIDKLAGATFSEEDLIIRCKSAVIPGKTINEIESYFMGMKQIFPGRVEFSHKMTTTVDETEDQKVHTALKTWQNKIFDTSLGSPTAGYSQLATKLGMVTDGTLRMFTYNGQKLPNDIIFKNMWPSGVAEVELNMTGTEKVAYSVTWTFDLWDYNTTPIKL